MPGGSDTAQNIGLGDLDDASVEVVVGDEGCEESDLDLVVTQLGLVVEHQSPGLSEAI
jgi:hypothetical protein